MKWRLRGRSWMLWLKSQEYPDMDNNWNNQLIEYIRKKLLEAYMMSGMNVGWREIAGEARLNILVFKDWKGTGTFLVQPSTYL